MSLKYNINLIHSNIKESYKETEIKEKSDKKFGNYFELNIISEDKELRIILEKKDIEGNVFNWKYFSNPLNEESQLVQRTSNINNISEHVKDIFGKNRFDENYLKNI
tara:strand:+ start:4078 stop:4398 length:321 start_codon:yes stop_codon:yes gene_type:complete